MMKIKTILIIISCLLVPICSGQLHPNWSIVADVDCTILKKNHKNILYLPEGNHTAKAIVTGRKVTDDLLYLTVASTKKDVKYCNNVQNYTIREPITSSCVFATTFETNLETISFSIGLGSAILQEFTVIAETIKVSWTTVKPIIFGHLVRLKCTVLGIPTFQPNVSKYWKVHKTHIFGGEEGIQGGKYDSCGSSVNSFDLCINNFNETDLRLMVSCSYDFNSSKEKAIVLQNESYIYPPTELERHHSFQHEGNTVIVVYDKIYPIPTCNLTLGQEQKTFQPSVLMLNGFYYKATFTMKLNLKPSMNKQQININCHAGLFIDKKTLDIEPKAMPSGGDSSHVTVSFVMLVVTTSAAMIL